MLRLEEGLLGILQRNIPSSQAGVPPSAAPSLRAQVWAFPALAGQAGLLLARKEGGPALLPISTFRGPEQQEAATPGVSRACRGWRPRDPMAGGVEQRLGSLTVFTCDDFEGDWRRVANGGFGQVFQARHKRWRTEYAIKCSPCLLPDATRYLPAPPLSFYRGKAEGTELPREGPSRLRLRIVQ